MIKLIKIFGILLIIAAFAGTSAFGLWVVTCDKFMDETKVTMDIRIPKNSGFNYVYRKVFKDLKTPPYFWRYLVKVRKLDSKIHYGFYRAENISISEFLGMIMNGKQYRIKVTFPEGYNIYDIAKRLDDSGITDEDDFLKKAKNTDFVYKLTNFKAPSLEGFLYPETYFFPPDTDAESVIRTMNKSFLNNLPKNFTYQSEKIGMKPYDVIILASIVQKETFDEKESRLVASVYHNRLRKRIRLQADPTVIYGKYQTFDGDIRFRDLRDKTNKYNTYKFYGLPPTPISNPTNTAINAVLNPAKTDYIFFVAGPDKKHYFSKTYSQHKRLVKKYQSRRRKLDN